jgi:hypothetical protein
LSSETQSIDLGGGYYKSTLGKEDRKIAVAAVLRDAPPVRFNVRFLHGLQRILFELTIRK